MRHHYLLFILFFTPVAPSYGVDNIDIQNNDLKWQFSLGLGAVHSDPMNRLGSTASISVNSNHVIYSLRTSGFNDEDNLLTCLFDAITFSDCNTTPTNIDEWGILFGRKYMDGTVTLSAGVGRVEGSGPKIVNGNFSTMGIPFEAYWLLSTGRYINSGVALLGNINNEESFIGVFFTIKLGKS